MSIAPSLQRYLDQTITYEVIQHEPTMSSMRTAEVCHVSGDRLAKGIVLRRDGGYLLAVLAASHRIRLQDLRTQIDDDCVQLASEDEIAQLFRDCARGAASATASMLLLTIASTHNPMFIWKRVTMPHSFTWTTENSRG